MFGMHIRKSTVDKAGGQWLVISGFDYAFSILCKLRMDEFHFIWHA